MYISAGKFSWMLVYMQMSIYTMFTKNIKANMKFDCYQQKNPSEELHFIWNV